MAPALAAPSGWNMIFELFGPPGAGKTTFAHALAGWLQERGEVAELGRTPDRALIAPALDCTPKSDLLTSVEAPYETLLCRLRERERLQGRIERLFELDLQEKLASVRS